MTKNIWLGLVFVSFVLLIAFRKQLVWVYWKYKRLKIKEQAFDLLGKHKFVEITGPSGIGKSWTLGHVFKQLEGVKLTNLPTPNSTYTLNETTLQAHMVSDWGVPHKWYYFLDDITTFQQWTKNKMGEPGYSKLQEYVGRAGKLGATFIWTNNGTPIDPVFEQNKNATWTVQWHFKFLERYSLIGIKTNERWYNFLPTIIAIDNQEIERFYDKFWNIPKENQTNFLNHTTEGTGAKELGAIIDKIEETNGVIDWNNETVKKIEEYLKIKRGEMRKVYKDKQRKDKLHQDLKDYGLDPNKPITGEDITRLEKKGRFKYLKDEDDKEKTKNKGKKKFSDKSNSGKSEQINPDYLDLDQINQDPQEDNE